MLKDSRDNFNPSCDIANSYFLAKVLPIVRKGVCILLIQPLPLAVVSQAYA